MNRLLQSSLLSQFLNIEHGFSTKSTPLQELQGINIVFPTQKHGTAVIFIDLANRNREFIADGLLTGTPGIAVGVRTADCVPILLYEPSAQIVGAVHAGWKGTRGRIIEHAVRYIIDHGGRAERLIAAFGPSIGMCCYSVPEDRANQFISGFGEDPQMVAGIEGEPHLNLAYGNFKQLTNKGVLREHIDYRFYCTSCDHERFVSFRRDGNTDKKNEIVSFISLSKEQ